jgi:glyoxylase-like metal-dependent hydrolase (beta-lactamase superfamily II)
MPPFSGDRPPNCGHQPLMPKEAPILERKIVRVMVGNMGTNCYLLADNFEIAVIDPGFEPERVLEEIEAIRSTTPNAPAPWVVKYIINTHGHIDHIGANARLKQLTGAQILIGRQDAEHLLDAGKNLSQFLEQPVTSPAADRLLSDGDRVTVGATVMKVMDAPGHTVGGICLIGDGFAFTGDTLFYASIGRTDFPGGSEKMIFSSLKRLVQTLPDDAMVYPGHEDPGLMRDIKRVNAFLSYYR